MSSSSPALRHIQYLPLPTSAQPTMHCSIIIKKHSENEGERKRERERAGQSAKRAIKLTAERGHSSCRQRRGSRAQMLASTVFTPSIRGQHTLYVTATITQHYVVNRLLRGGWLIIMAGPEQMEGHQTHANHSFCSSHYYDPVLPN